MQRLLIGIVSKEDSAAAPVRSGQCDDSSQAGGVRLRAQRGVRLSKAVSSTLDVPPAPTWPTTRCRERAKPSSLWEVAEVPRQGTQARQAHAAPDSPPSLTPGRVGRDRPAPRVLFVAAGGERQASSRYRIYQFHDLLEQDGVSNDIFPWQSDLPLAEERVQADELIEASRDYEVVYFHRVVLSRSAFRAVDCEILRRKATVYDLDDAIYAVASPVLVEEERVLAERSARSLRVAFRRMRRRLGGGVAFSERRRPVERMFGSVDAVVAGNAVLAEVARRFCDRVYVAPTVLDVQEMPVKRPSDSGSVVVGWVGHADNLFYVEGVVPAFRALRERYGDRVRFKVVSSAPLVAPGLEIENKAWALDEETTDVLSFDVGIMPLTDDDWARGKCAFKALLYGALGIPAVVSPVGMNSEVVVEGETGYLADTIEEWTLKLGLLVDDSELRARLGSAARRRVERNYSVEVALAQMHAAIRDVTG